MGSENNSYFSQISDNNDSGIDSGQEIAFSPIRLSDFIPDANNGFFENLYPYPYNVVANEGSSYFVQSQSEQEASCSYTPFQLSYDNCHSSYAIQQVHTVENFESSVQNWTNLEPPVAVKPVSTENENQLIQSATVPSIASAESQDADHSSNSIQSIINVDAVPTNDSAETIVKRNLAKESKADAKRRSMKDRQIAKHAVKGECNCLKSCPLKISFARRIEINNAFNLLASPVEQKLYIRGLTSPSTKKGQTDYFLVDDVGVKQNVCLIFFLTTFGFKPNNTTFVRSALKCEFPAEDRRGKYVRDNQLTETNVMDHIMGFEPQVSHHRRVHAPNRLYLPTDVSIGKMHSLFVSTHPEKNCSYDYYRKMVDKMNISFSKLGHEKCEECEIYEQHQSLCSEQGCQVCDGHVTHKQQYDRARIEYESDKLKPYDPKHIRVSTDQQKVVMLPRIEQFKEVLFTNRLRVFNQTFAPLGSTKFSPVFACIWHDAIAGKKKEDVISSYHAFFLKYRDTDEFTIWADNCTAQNKCWALFSFFVYIVNSSEITAKKINIKFLEKGHTFMSADSFHHQVELSMKNRKMSAVYDFEDFVDSVHTANGGRVYCKEMHNFNFTDWPDWSSTAKLNKCEPRPYINGFTKLMFLRGKTSMYYANEFNEDFTELDFIMSKNMNLQRPSSRTENKGINPDTKKGIVDKLTGLMPPNRRQFWQNL